MNPSARSALTLAVLLVLPQLQALCPRLAPDVISGKVIPCRYLCIKINFLELPSIILSTERDGVLCSTLLLRRRGVCRNGGCIPFGSDDEIKPKGALGKVIAAIDKFASGSYRQKAPTPGTPFGPIVSTATSLFGGSSSTTSGGTSNAASSIVATATAAAVGSTFKSLFSGSTSSSSVNSRRNEQPPLSPFSPSLLSKPKPDYPVNTAGGTPSGGSSAVPVNFGGGPPILPPSTEVGAENEGTQAAPGTPLTDSRVPSEHPASTPFSNPQPSEPKGSLNSGSASDASTSNGSVIKTALGIVFGNLREISAASTSGIPSRQKTPAGTVETPKPNFDSPVRTFVKTTTVPPNGVYRDATGGSSANRATFQRDGVPPIVPPSSSPDTESDGKERLRGFADPANVFRAGHGLIAPAATTVTNVRYHSKLPTIASSPSRSPSIESQSPEVESAAGSSTRNQLKDAFGAALTKLRGISQGSTHNMLPSQPSLAAFGETSAPSSRSSVIPLHKGTSGIEVNRKKETVTNVASVRSRLIATEYGHGRPAISPPTAVVAEREREETLQRSQTPKNESQPINTAAEADNVSTGTFQGTSLPSISNPVDTTSSSIGTAPPEPPRNTESESSSGNLIKKSFAKTLKTLHRFRTTITPTISVRRKSSAGSGESSKPRNNSRTEVMQKSANEPEVKPATGTAEGALYGSTTNAIDMLGGAPPSTVPSAITQAESEHAGASRLSAAPSVVSRPVLNEVKPAEGSVTNVRGSLQNPTNTHEKGSSPAVRSAEMELSAASKSATAVRSQIKKTFGPVLNTSRRRSNSTTPTSGFRQPSQVLAAETSTPINSSSTQSTHKGASGPDVKRSEKTISGVLPGSPPIRNAQLGSGTQPLPPLVMGATDTKTVGTSPSSAAPNRVLLPTNVGAESSDSGIADTKINSRIPTNQPVNGSLSSIGNPALEFPSASRSSSSGGSPSRLTSSSGSRMEKTLMGALGTSRLISKNSQPLIPSKELPLVPLNGESKPIISFNKAVSGPQKGHPKVGKKAIIRGSTVTTPAAISHYPPTVHSPTEKSAKRGSVEVAQGPMATALRPISAKAVTAEPSSSKIEANPQLPSSTSADMNSMGSDQVGPANFSRTLSSLESRPHNSPAKGTTPSAKELPSQADAGTPKQTTYSQAHSSRTAATSRKTQPSITTLGAFPKVPSSTPENKLLPSMVTAPVGPATSPTLASLRSPQQNLPLPGTTAPPKELLSGHDVETSKQSNNSQAHTSLTAATAANIETSLNIRGSRVELSHAVRSRAPLLGGGGLAAKTSPSRTLTFSRNTLAGKLKGTKNLGIKDSVASPSKNLDSTKPKTASALNTGVQHAALAGLSSAVPHTAPKPLSTPSYSMERPSLSIGSTSQATKSTDVETKIANKSITKALARVREKLLSRRKENTGTFNEKGSYNNNLPQVKSSSRDKFEANVMDRTNGPSKKEGQLNLPNHVPPVSELGSASGPIASRPSRAHISPINPTLHTAILQGNKEGLALGHKTEKRISPTMPSGTGTTDTNESVNKPNNSRPSTRTSSDREEPLNTVSPRGKVPSTDGSALSAAVTGSKNTPSSISSISHGNTTATPPMRIATFGAAFSTHSGNQLATKPIEAVANQALTVAGESKSSSSSYGSKRGSETSRPVDKRANPHGTGEHFDVKNTSSQSTSNSSGWGESKMSPSNDTSSKAVFVSTENGMDVTSSFASEKRSSGLAAPPVATPTLASTALGIPSPASVPDVNAANRTADTLQITTTSGKHAPTVGSISEPKGTVSLGQAAEGVETPSPSPGKPTNTRENVYKSSTTGTQAVLVLKPTSRLAAPTLGVPGAISGSAASVPSTAPASKTDSRNLPPETSQNEVTKAENVTGPGSPSDLAASAPIRSAPHSAQAPRQPTPTSANNSVQNEGDSTSRFGLKAGVSGGNASRNAKTPKGSAGRLEKGEMNSAHITAPTSSRSAEKIVSSNPVTPKNTTKPTEKRSGIIEKLGSLLYNGRDALRSGVQSGGSVKPNLKLETTTKRENAVAEAGPTTVAPKLSEPTGLQNPSSQPALGASSASEIAPIINTEQPTSALYTRGNPLGGLVFGRPPSVPGGFWDPARRLPGMFGPF